MILMEVWAFAGRSWRIRRGTWLVGEKGLKWVVREVRYVVRMLEGQCRGLIERECGREVVLRALVSKLEGCEEQRCWMWWMLGEGATSCVVNSSF